VKSVAGRGEKELRQGLGDKPGPSIAHNAAQKAGSRRLEAKPGKAGGDRFVVIAGRQVGLVGRIARGTKREVLRPYPRAAPRPGQAGSPDAISAR